TIKHIFAGIMVVAVLCLQACVPAAPELKVDLGVPAPPPISVQLSPASTQVQAGSGAQFNATVSNSSNTSVTWQVNGIAGGDGANGTITSFGRYFAPAAVPANVNIMITAVSDADRSKSATATVTLFAAHRIAVRTVLGSGQFYDSTNGAVFLPRGNNYI